MSLAAVNHIYIFHEVMNGCKDSLKACFENVNIYYMNFKFSVNLLMQFHNQYGFIMWMKNCVDPDQLASSEAS